MDIEIENTYDTDDNKQTDVDDTQQSTQTQLKTSTEYEIEQNNIYQKKLLRLQNKIESKRIRKNYKMYISIPFLLKQNICIKDQFTIFGGINVLIGEEIYLESQYQKTSIGDIKQPLQITFNIEKDRVDCLQQPQQKGREDFQFLVELCLRKQSQEYKELADLINVYYEKTLLLPKIEKYVLKMKKSDLFEIDKDYQQFVKFCFDYINKMDQSDIFSYNIGKLNYFLGDIEIQYSGCSTGYFHLLGINYEIYQQLILRGKSFSLKSKWTNNISMSINALQQRLQYEQCHHQCEYDIKTIDGFLLKLKEKVIKLQSPFVRNQITPIDHICNIIVCEIDPEQIQRLIQYREQLVIENNLSSYDQYIQKIYEDNLQDIEYTVLSENFLQKYYPDKYKQQTQNLFKQKQ